MAETTARSSAYLQFSTTREQNFGTDRGASSQSCACLVGLKPPSKIPQTCTGHD